MVLFVWICDLALSLLVIPNVAKCIFLPSFFILFTKFIMIFSHLNTAITSLPNTPLQGFILILNLTHLGGIYLWSRDQINSV